jgi:hypothetical protein
MFNLRDVVHVSKGDITKIQSDAVIATMDTTVAFQPQIHEALAARMGSVFFDRIQSEKPLTHGQIFPVKAMTTIGPSFKHILAIVDVEGDGEALCFVVMKALIAASKQGFAIVTMPPIYRDGMRGPQIVNEQLEGIRLFINATPGSTIRKIEIVVPESEPGLAMMFGTGL